MAAVSQPCSLRPAEARDAAEMARLSDELGYPSTKEMILQRFSRIESDPDHAVFVAEKSAGCLAGWVHVYVGKLIESDRRAEIGGLVVDREARRAGIGRALMTRAQEWAVQNELKLVSLRCNSLRSDAPRFYESIGYRNSKTQINFRKEL